MPQRNIHLVVEAAKKEGTIVNSIDELVCRHNHKDAKFVKKDKNDPYDPDHREPTEYVCGTCVEEKHSYPSKAYDCPNCGIVVGFYRTEPYRTSDETWRQLAGRSGIKHYCRICNEEIGHVCIGKN